MQTKQIAFMRANHAELIDCEVKPMTDDTVLVKTLWSTVSSGTERANLTGELNVSVSQTFTEATFPRFPGYCSAGIVEQVGAYVTHVKPGDRVAVSWGCHAAYNVVDASNVHKIPSDAVSLADAGMALISTFPMAAIRKCRLEIGESAIIMGFGILGMMGLQLLRAAGAAPVIVADPVPEKRAQALSLGADYAVDPFAPDFVEQVKALTNGGVQVAIEVTGNGKALDSVLDCMARMGRVALLGCTRHSDFTIDYYRKVHGPGISLIGAHTAARPKTESYPGYWTTADDIQAYFRLIALGRIQPSRLVEEVHSPAEATEIYDRLATKPNFPVVQFDWSRLEH